MKIYSINNFLYLLIIMLLLSIQLMREFTVSIHPFVFVSIIILYSFNLLKNKFIYKIPFVLLLGLILIIVGAVTSTMYNQINYDRIVSLIMYLLFFITIYNWSKNNFDLEYISLIASVTILFVYIYYFITTDPIIGGRFVVDYSTRQIANFAGPSIILLLFSIMYNDKYKNIKSLLLVLCLGMLLSTQSRGVIIALLVSIAIYLFINIYNKHISNHKIIITAISIIVLIPILLYISSHFGVDIERAKTRMTSEEEFIDNIRLQIWMIAFYNIDILGLFIGSGMDSFSIILSESTGGLYEYYAHSVFIDAIFSIGVIGFIGLLILQLYSIRVSLLKKNYIGLVLMIYIIISYAFHGTITRPDYWFYLSIAVYLSCRNNKFKIKRGFSKHELFSLNFK